MKHPLRRRWLMIAFGLLRLLARWLPLTVAQAVGAVVGYGAYGLLRRHRAVSLAHLQQAFGPSMSARARARIARRLFLNLGKTLMEWFVLERCSPARIRRLVEVHGLAHLSQGLAQGRGVIALSAHFGNWELLAMALASLGFEGGVVARRLRYPEYEGFLWSLRARHGVATYDRGSIKDVATVLRANRMIGIMPDQDLDSLEGVFVDFFDRPTYTPVGPAALALVTGAPIIPCFIIRAGRRFRIMIEEPIPIPRGEGRERNLAGITQAWSRLVESYIRHYPDQWVWMHRRWKTQPEIVHRRLRQRPARQELAPVLPCLLGASLWWLSAASGEAKPPATPAPMPVEQPDPAASEAAPAHQMGGFTMAGYAADGAKRWELAGTGARAEGAFVTITRPDAVGYEPDQTAYVTASLAQVDQAKRRVRLEHEVTMHTTEGWWLSSPTMYWLPDRSELLTDDAVRLETSHLLLRGRGATSSTQLNQTVILHDVELLLNQASEERAPGGDHVTITCDGPLTFDATRHLATFEQNVHVHDRQSDLSSDRLMAYLDQANRTLTYAEAIRNVRIVQGSHTAESRRAIYEPAQGTITLLGSPSLLIEPDEPSVVRE